MNFRILSIVCWCFVLAQFSSSAQVLTQAQKELYNAVISGDTAGLRLSLKRGADPGHFLISPEVVTITPLVLASGLGDQSTVKTLLDHGAMLSAQNDELLTASWFNQPGMMEMLLARGQDFKQSAEDGLHIITKGLRVRHWRDFCLALSQAFMADTLNEEMVYRAYFSMRLMKPDATDDMALSSMLVYLNRKGLHDDDFSALAEDKPHLLAALVNNEAFQPMLLKMPGCSKYTLLEKDLLKDSPQAKRKLIMSLKDLDGADPASCKEALYTKYLYEIMDKGDVTRFWEFEPAIDIAFLNSVGATYMFDFIMFKPVLEEHYEIISHLVSKGLASGGGDDRAHSLFGMLCYNSGKGEYRARLIDDLIGKVKQDKAAMNRACYLAEDEETLRKLVEQGADVHYRLHEKARQLLLQNNTGALSYVLSKADTLTKVTELAEMADTNEELQVLKHFFLRRKLVNSELPVKDQPLKTLMESAFKRVADGVRYEARVWRTHMHAGKTPTDLFVNKPMLLPSQKDGLNLGSFTKTTQVPDGIHQQYEINLDLSVQSFTAQSPTLYIGNVAMIKKGDRIYNKGGLEVTIPKMPFDGRSAVFFPTVDVRYACSGKGEIVKAVVNGKESTLTSSSMLIVDVSQGDFTLKITNMEGWSLGCYISLIPHYPVQPVTYRSFAHTISGSFSERERIRNYASLYENSLFDKDLTALKNSQVSTNILSHGMLTEKYPQYVAEQLRQSAERISTMDKDLNKLRQFYVLNKKITIQDQLDLRILFQQIDLHDITDAQLKQKLEKLNRMLIEQANDSEILSQYLDTFTSKYFQNVNQEITFYQGLILELAQFISDQQIEKIYRDSNISVNSLHRVILGDENMIASEYLDGRGKFLRTLVSQ
ncbi:ankyrin repeat domain-containing protein [Fulvivirgaceae bacterium PWU4]|uniref:Ankyrin repeat domain-containing protein n=1 Tax=Chryseosolibacter histidini TaxID=2782349 RepID=A0AAP2DIU7_9BACT|nr:ankyrin repeat domain-containing protein [Chryseosolibacter histidini]MBT1697115.1 ankyrin repeat domain-containing protein [Chryseosolibacter histidini]